MKIFVIKVSKILASVALIITTLNVNTTCVFVAHQPELPEGAEKLRKKQ